MGQSEVYMGRMFISSIRCDLEARKCQYLVSGLLHSTMRLVRNEFLEGNIILMFCDEKYIPTLFSS